MKTDRHTKRSEGRRLCQVPLLVTGFVALWVALVSLLALPRLAKAQNAEHGKELFERRCTACHGLDKNKEGPRLRGVYGRMSGSVPSFPYSDGVKAAHITWDAMSLDKWLTDTEKLIPNNDMGIQIAKAEERADIIAYLKQLPSN